MFGVDPGTRDTTATPLALLGHNDKGELHGRYAFAFEGADRFRFEIENSRDGGNTWSTFIEASYQKTA